MTVRRSCLARSVPGVLAAIILAGPSHGQDDWQWQPFPGIEPAATRVDELLETPRWQEPLRTEQNEDGERTVYHYKFANGDVAISAINGVVFTVDVTPQKKIGLEQIVETLKLGEPVRCSRLAEDADRGLPVPKAWTIHRCAYNVVVFSADPAGKSVTRIRYFPSNPALDPDDPFGMKEPEPMDLFLSAQSEAEQKDLGQLQIKTLPSPDGGPTIIIVEDVPNSKPDDSGDQVGSGARDLFAAVDSLEVPVWQFRGITPGSTSEQSLLANTKWGQPIEIRKLPPKLKVWCYRISDNDVLVYVRDGIVQTIDLFFDLGAPYHQITEVLKLTSPLGDEPLPEAANIGVPLPADWRVKQFDCGRVAVYLEEADNGTTAQLVRFYRPEG